MASEVQRLDAFQAVCEECEWSGHIRGFSITAEKDARDHDEAVHRG